MKNGDVYRKAAELVANKRFSREEHFVCCNAIRRNSENRTDEGKNISLFAAYFMPEGYSEMAEWFGSPSDDANRAIRIMALCFMAAIAADL